MWTGYLQEIANRLLGILATDKASANVTVVGGTVVATIDEATLATAAKQDTQTTALGTLATDAHLTALTSANHTDLAAVLAKLSSDPATQTTLAAVLAKLTSDPATQTTIAAILAKQPSAPALESGHLATIDTSTATTATQTTTTATNTGTLAGAVAAQNAALPTGVVVEGGVGSSTAPTSVTTGNTVRKWLGLAGGTVITGLYDLTAAALTKAASTAAAFTDAAVTVDVRPGGVFPAASASADGEALSTPITRVGARLWGYSPAGNFSVLRSGQVVPGAITGWLNTLSGSVYNASPTARTEGQGGPLQADTNGNQLTSLATLIAGEDLTNNVMGVAGEYSFSYISTTTTTTIKSGAGLLGGMTIAAAALATITIYDNTAGSGTVIWSQTMPATLLSSIYVVSFGVGIKFTTGLTVVTGVAAQNIVTAYK